MSYTSEELQIQLRLIRDHFDSWATQTPEQMKSLVEDILEEEVDIEDIKQFYLENNYLETEDAVLIIKNN